MANDYFLCIVRAMDRLWFHRVILFSEPLPKTIETTYLPSSDSEPLLYPSSTFSLPHLPNEDTPSDGSLFPEQPTISMSSQEEKDKEERPTRLKNLIMGRRNRSQSSSPSTQKRPRRHRYSAPSTRVLQKSMSCRTLGELELEEVKGFLDLGFTFKKEHLSPRMMSVVPGLQRLGIGIDPKENTASKAEQEEDEIEQEKEMKGVITRPYLSEAWLIKRPDSPLLNLRIPKVSAASDMKKHLKFWAKTVASVLEQES